MLTFFSTELQIGPCTQTCATQFHHVYSESSLSFALPFSGRAGTPFGQTSPCLWTGTYFLNFSQSCSLRSFSGARPVLRGIAHRLSVVRPTFRCLVNRTLQPAFGSAARVMMTHLHPLSTPRASSFAHQRLLWCFGGSNSTGHEFL